MSTDRFTLPDSIVAGANRRGNEYGWTVEAFPVALKAAEKLGYACLGGQFQFRIPEATCEMYWIDADSAERLPGESWPEYVQRSCAEVSASFQSRIASTDFAKEALSWPCLKFDDFDPHAALVFVADFVTEAEYAELGKPSA